MKNKRTITIREAIAKALQSSCVVEAKIKHCIIALKCDSVVMHVYFQSPKIDDHANLAFDTLFSFNCDKSVGLLCIAQAIELQYNKIKLELTKRNMDCIASFRNKADACIVAARELEDLMRGK